MKKCECGHPSAFHPETEKKVKSGLAQFADNVSSAFGPTERRPACHGETKSGKPCPCQRYTPEE